MAEIQQSAGKRWGPLLGYSQTVSYGNLVRVAATAGARDEVVGSGDPYAQTGQVISNLKAALGALGAGIEHVVRTRVYVADAAHWPSIARAYGEVFTEVNPERRIVGMRRLSNRDSLVEIEADALVPHRRLRGDYADPRGRPTPDPDAD
ncbi:MAG: Rid family hydrolase [Candidatus Krumholzibacteriia bacterium]